MSDSIIYRELSMDDATEFRQMYYEFMADEPLSSMIGMETPEDCRGFVEQNVALALESCLSHVAVDKFTGKLVGIRSCLLHTKDRPVRLNFSAADLNPKLTLFTRVFAELYKGIDIFDYLKTDAVVLFRGLFVKGEYRNRGIAKKLHKFSLKENAKKGFKAFVGETSNTYSRAIYDRLGFETAKCITLGDLYIDGERVVKNEDKRTKHFVIHSLKL